MLAIKNYHMQAIYDMLSSVEIFGLPRGVGMLERYFHLEISIVISISTTDYRR